MSTEMQAQAEAQKPWVIVALYPDGRVCAASMLGYTNEAEFRAECKGFDILIVPGPIALREPLTAEQLSAAVTDRDAAMHERATLVRQVVELAGEVQRLRAENAALRRGQDSGFITIHRPFPPRKRVEDLPISKSAQEARHDD